MTQRAAIKAVKSFLPKNKLTNEQLAEQFGDWHASQILAKTGVAVRGVAGPDECASDLGVAAAKRLFDEGRCSPDEIDFLIFCTQSPDYFTPTTACVMQDALGLRTSCGAIDINQGCSGYIYGLAFAKSLVEAGTAPTVLLITADTYLKFINPRDRSLLTLFGDGAAATLVRATESERELIGPFVLGSDGRGASQIIVKAGGLRHRPTSETQIEKEDSSGNWRSDENLFMDGADVFSFALRTVPPTLQQLLEKAGLTMDQIDFIIPHQANKFVLERLRAKLKFPAEKFWIDMEDSGNTVSSTIPIALEKALGQERVKPGDRVALVGFGVGYSWGATIVEVT
ncbi:MAG TPA: ketoacyl-ACP synthase III [Pyrinomonadaceae bacterium]|jgi:3-oxoacyl-[acyl-carrier-protein] synthase-3|nr:ketoacyl-ACP synthase III [Pyrinomonadaceae bacterium]